MKKITFSASYAQLSGNIFLPEKSDSLCPAILFIHGWTSKQDGYFNYAAELARNCYICMTFDMRGHGASAGDISILTTNDFLSDVIAAFDFLTQIKGVDKQNIVVVGSSFGSYLATLLSSVRPCAALALRVPANYPDEGMNDPHFYKAKAYYEGLTDEDKRKWKSTIHSYTATASLRAIHEFKGRVLLVESENDVLVPHEIVQSYSQALPNKNKLTNIVMKGAPHSITRDDKRQREFLSILTNWLKTQ